MRLLLIGNYLPDEQNSMLRYSEMLRREMSARGHEVHVIAPEERLGSLRRGGFVGKWLGYVDKYLLFPRTLRRVAPQFDWAHVCDHSNAMYMPCLDSARSSITCHDLLAIEAAAGDVHSVAEVGRRVGFTGRTQQRWIRKNLLAAPRVICISHATERSLRAMGAAGEITTIPNPLNREFKPAPADAVMAVRRKIGLHGDEPFLLHIGGNQWYKNRAGAMRIAAALMQHSPTPGLRLVMAGKPWTAEMVQVAASHGLKGGEVVAMDDPTDEEVEALYTAAAALLFPSLQEGFGWPVIEAQRCGCPVITSDRDPMREIAGGAALLIDPADETGAAETIAAGWSRLPELRSAGLVNAQGYTAHQLMPLYDAFFRLGEPSTYPG